MNPDAITVPDIQGLIDNPVSLFGLMLSRDAVAVLLIAVLFFVGAGIGCALKLNGKVHPLRVLLGAIPVFLLSVPASARLVGGQWGISNIAPLDQVVKWVENSGPLPRAFFAFGIVMVLGMFSWHILQVIIRLAGKLLGYFERKADKRLTQN
jgi:hypothetical protein